MALLRLFLGIVFLHVTFLFLAQTSVFAQTPSPTQCYPSRVINQYACLLSDCYDENDPTTCCESGGRKCSGDPTRTCTEDGTECNASGPYPNAGTCQYFCDDYISGTSCQQTSSNLGTCTSASAGCKWTGTVTTCSTQSTTGSCTESLSSWVYGCWGPGGTGTGALTPTPTPTGPTPTPGGPTPTPTPASPPIVCGDNRCDLTETCSSCPGDCGTCPVQKGTVRSRAWQVSPTDTSCAAVYGATTPVAGTVFSTSPSSGASQGQSGTNYVSWTNVDAGTYTLIPQPPAGYVLRAACWGRTATAPTSGTGLSSSFIADGETLSWDIGYTLGTPWTQVNGGDVYAATNLVSYVPSTVAPRVFIADGPGGSPGVATYGQTANFDGTGLTNGSTWVSGKNWLAKDTAPTVNYYQLMYRRLGGTPTTVDYINPSSPIARPASRAKPYYVTGNMTTSGDWVVGNGETLIFLVNGNLTIAGNINITGSGFVAFIVNGNITVNPAVGVAYTSSNPVVEGIYMTSPSGVFDTGNSSSVGRERFVGKGTFVAGNFLLKRDLESVGQNNTASAELFIYNPRLLITMPEAMKESPIFWQEVAP